MKCAVIQPSYIPWRGYFDQIRRADVFVFYDDVQFDKHGWRNRNRIKGPNGPVWLTIPVKTKGSVEHHLRIDAIQIADRRWGEKHLSTLRQNYAKAPHLEPYLALMKRHLTDPPELLTDLTIPLTIELATELGIETRYVRSSELDGLEGRSTERLLGVLEAVGASHYLSGPSARSYMDEELLADAGISLEYMSYEYPEYPQLHPPFDPQVSILDLLFSVGPDAPSYLS